MAAFGSHACRHSEQWPHLGYLSFLSNFLVRYNLHTAKWTFYLERLTNFDNHLSAWNPYSNQDISPFRTLWSYLKPLCNQPILFLPHVPTGIYFWGWAARTYSYWTRQGCVWKRERGLMFVAQQLGDWGRWQGGLVAGEDSGRGINLGLCFDTRGLRSLFHI